MSGNVTALQAVIGKRSQACKAFYVRNGLYTDARHGRIKSTDRELSVRVCANFMKEDHYGRIKQGKN